MELLPEPLQEVKLELEELQQIETLGVRVLASLLLFVYYNCC